MVSPAARTPYCPTGHDVQSDASTVPSCDDVPAGQYVHVSLEGAPSADEYVCFGHLVQVALDTAATRVEYVPPQHSLHGSWW